MRDDATLLFLSCQQAEFVEAALSSVFAQEDVRLRIILSDDASTDGSWELIRRAADAYRGPHEVETRRNATRQGLVSHLNALMPEVRSDLVLLAASDDISRPDRAARLTQAWRAAGEPRAYLTSDARFIDEFGRPGELRRAHPLARDTTLAGIVREMGGDVLGCASAYHRDVWGTFGPLTVSRMVEDRPLAFRAAALDAVLHIQEPLVDYRVHRRNLSHAPNVSALAESEKKRRWDFQVQIFGQFGADLEHPAFTTRHGAGAVAAARREADKRWAQARLGLDYLASRGWPRWKLILRAGLLGRSGRRLLGWSWETLTRSQPSAVVPKA